MANRRNPFEAPTVAIAFGVGVIAVATVGVVVGTSQAQDAAAKSGGAVSLWSNGTFVISMAAVGVGGLLVILGGVFATINYVRGRKDDGAEFAFVMAEPGLRFTWHNQISPLGSRVNFRFSNVLPDLAIEYQLQSMKVEIEGTIRISPEATLESASFGMEISPSADDWQPIGPASTIQGPTYVVPKLETPTAGLVISCTVWYRVCDARLVYEREWRGRVVIAAPEHSWPNVNYDWEQMINARPRRVKLPLPDRTLAGWL